VKRKNKGGNVNNLMSRLNSRPTISEKLAVGYIRVSTDMQVEEGHSLETQQQTIFDYCKYHKLSFSKFYPERGLSGKNTERPQLQLLLEELQPGTIIIITSLSRLSRNVKDTLTLLEQIKQKGATLIIIDLNVDTSTASGDLIMNIMASVSQFERKQTVERVRNTMDHMARQGQLITKPPFGYKVEKEGKISKLVEDEQEQLIIDKIRNIIKDDPRIPVASIVRKLTIDGVQIRKSNCIYHFFVSKIIKENNLRPDIIISSLQIS
jgi:site-specific DNA recombinase